MAEKTAAAWVERRAALVVCDRATDAQDAAAILRALGLAEPVHARVWRKQDGVLGPRPKDATTVRRDCGSVPGAQAHHRAGEPLCAVCHAWSEKRHRDTRTPAGAKCATPSGAQMHRSLGEKVCVPCAEAEAAASRARYTPTGKPVGRPCRTEAS